MNAGQRPFARLRLRIEGVTAQDALWLLAMALMLFAVLLPSSSYVASLSFIQGEWGLNNTQAGAVFSAYLAGYAVSALFIVPLTDRLGSRHILLAAAAVSALSHVLFPLVAQGLASGAALMALSGVGWVGVYMPGLRVISERFPERGRGMAMGAYVTASYAATSVSLAGTGALMSALEWREAYLVMALASAGGLPLAYLLLRSPRYSSERQASGMLDLTVLRSRPVRVFVLAYSLHAFELYAVRVWLPAFLAAVLIARGADSARAAVTAATVGGIALAVGSVGPVMGGFISDRWGRATSGAAIFALSGAFSWAIGWLGGLPWGLIIGVTVVYGWAIAADSAIYSTAITEVASAGRLGSTMAAQAFLGFMGGVIGPVVVGGILDLSPQSIRWGLGFSLIGALSLVAIAGLIQARLLDASRVGRSGP